jgi:predicted nucleic acid-binding protein
LSYLLDTNVVSEWARPQPEPNVVAWLAALDEDDVFMSVVSFAELGRGVELLPPGRRREGLATWIARDLTERFHGRVLDVDRRVADCWGHLMARCQRSGRTPTAMDAFFAATAESHGLTLVTRNVRDFEGLNVPLLNPWDAA